MRYAWLGIAALIAACGAPSVTELGGENETSEEGDFVPDAAPDATPVLYANDGTACTAANRSQVVIWGLRQWQGLADAFAANPGECTDYFISIPPVDCGDGTGKTCPRGPLAPEKIRALGPQFHAMAEFHWTSWRKWTEATGKDWEQAGKEFRKRMVDANYDVAAGDTWAVNEFPSTVRSGEGPARMNSRKAVRGLHSGPAGALPKQGAVFIVGMGQGTTNFSVYKPMLKKWLDDDDYWATMDGRVRFWAQEAYAEPKRVCVPGSMVASRATRINEFAQHVARLPPLGPSGLNRAQAYFDKAYVPLMNASWQQPDGSGYGGTEISATEMAKFVAVQVYAERSWAKSHAYPDRRVGFSYAPAAGVTSIELAPIAERMAWSVRDAYAPGGEPINACNPAGTYSGCQCSVNGAKFTNAWEAFASY